MDSSVWVIAGTLRRVDEANIVTAGLNTLTSKERFLVHEPL